MTDSSSDETASPAMTARAVDARDERLRRESDALRANLLRRKAQARARRATDPDLPEGHGLG
jgi:hypothetical protein